MSGNAIIPRRRDLEQEFVRTTKRVRRLEVNGRQAPFSGPVCGISQYANDYTSTGATDSFFPDLSLLTITEDGVDSIGLSLFTTKISIPQFWFWWATVTITIVQSTTPPTGETFAGQPMVDIPSGQGFTINLSGATGNQPTDENPGIDVDSLAFSTFYGTEFTPGILSIALMGLSPFDCYFHPAPPD